MMTMSRTSTIATTFTFSHHERQQVLDALRICVDLSYGKFQTALAQLPIKPKYRNNPRDYEDWLLSLTAISQMLSVFTIDNVDGLNTKLRYRRWIANAPRQCVKAQELTKKLMCDEFRLSKDNLSVIRHTLETKINLNCGSLYRVLEDLPYDYHWNDIYSFDMFSGWCDTKQAVCSLLKKYMIMNCDLRYGLPIGYVSQAALNNYYTSRCISEKIQTIASQVRKTVPIACLVC